MKEKPLAESGCVLVCGGKSCKKAGSGKLRKALERAAEDTDAKVMVLKTKCLGGCGKGPVVNAWPKGVCFTEATPDDAMEILTAAGVTVKKKKEKKGKVVKEKEEVKVKAKKEVKAKAAKAPKATPPKAKKAAKAKKPDKIAPPKGEATPPEAHGYAE